MRRSFPRDDFNPKRNTVPKRVNFNFDENLTQSRNTDGRGVCYNCREPGHHIRNCPVKHENRPPSDRSPHRNMQSNVGLCQTAQQIIHPYVNIYKNRLMFVYVKIKGREIYSLVDTGSEMTMISHDLALELELEIENYTGRQINGINSQPVKISGQVQLDIVVFDNKKQRTIPIKAVTVIDFHLNLLLGYDFHYAAKSQIDIYNNNIVFNSVAIKESDKLNVKEPKSSKILHKMHAIENVEIPANGMSVVKCVPSYKEALLNANCFTHSNPTILSRRMLYVKEQNITIKKGIARIPVVNLSEQPALISAGSIISDYELPATCAGAFSKLEIDPLLNANMSKIIQKDKLAYLIFCHIKSTAESTSESILSILNRLCKYCISIECLLGEQCPKKQLYMTNCREYKTKTVSKYTNVLLLCGEYTLMCIDNEEKLRKEQSKHMKEHIESPKTFLLTEDDIKRSAEHLFNQIYAYAVDSNDPINVIYYFEKLCKHCNRYKCSDEASTCIYESICTESINYKNVKIYEKILLEIKLMEFIKEWQIPTEVIDHYRSTMNTTLLYLENTERVRDFTSNNNNCAGIMNSDSFNDTNDNFDHEKLFEMNISSTNSDLVSLYDEIGDLNTPTNSPSINTTIMESDVHSEAGTL
jgi:hypothetical protein